MKNPGFTPLTPLEFNEICRQNWDKTMTDRELLELAAKAAGYNVRWHDIWKCFVHNEPHNIDNPPTPSGDRHVWVPLTDDGDALRLACDLRIGITQRVEEVRVANRFISAIYEPVGDDRAKATRRAIVAAAAETYLRTK